MTNPKGRFGIHGGQYVPEILMNAVHELEQAYDFYKNDPEFNRELTQLFNEYAGRPSLLYYAEKMTKDSGVFTYTHRGLTNPGTKTVWAETNDGVSSNKITLTSDERGLVITLAGDSFFAEGSAELRIDETRETLLRLAQFLSGADLANRRFRIEGHTDNVIASRLLPS